MKQKQLECNRQQGIQSLLIIEGDENNVRRSRRARGHHFLHRTILMFMLLLASSTFSFAQFEWGIKFGANASTQAGIGNICDNNELKAGLNFGVIGRYQFNDWMALKSGIDFQQKGLKCNSKADNSEIKNNLNYLVLPLKAEFSASEKAGFKNGQRLFFATGPYFGYLLDATETIQEQTRDLENLNEFDFGWSFELGMEFPVFEKKAIQVSLNYDMGISEIASDTDIQNKSASINLGFLF